MIVREKLFEAQLDSYLTFFDIEFDGMGMNDTFAIQGNRYIIDDMNIGTKESVVHIIIKGIDTEERVKVFVDTNTNKAFDIQNLIIPPNERNTYIPRA